ncbi:CRISPR-associated protein (Cas_Csy2) [Roseivivax halotolerans]|uniref:CRISPR-associated protein (Cas_Csy2) n=1 Tax=Roseivivax halotolerans TaxID=93684 RepID=A0A1I6AKT3_9RHOB|nr:type I-F CRISPR-associated protein Csy2 [Roseivivax halotolerans]SFQ69127.1 CRISPR-associated protein (Cas_Csy2) [Roseivivax halotolerans]
MIFVAKNIRAARVNLLMNDYAAGLPSPLSFIGLADAIIRDLGLTSWSGRALPILHRVEPSDGRTKPEMENKSGSFSPVETMEDLVGSVDLSLILDIPECDSDTDLSGALMRRRIAGGLIQNDQVDVTVPPPDGSAFKGLRRGYAILPPDPARPDACAISTGDEASFTGILDTLFPDERKPGSGWFVPVAAGYHLLEDPDETPARIRRRDPNIPHVFAEPVLGLAELVSVRNPRLTGLTEAGLSSLLWSWTVEGDYLFGHASYLSNATHKENIVHG